MTTDVAGAKVKNFTPEKGVRDRFGNRLFTSSRLAYMDGRGEKVKAGILISPEGERFIEENPGILQEIDDALVYLESNEGQMIINQTIGLKNGNNLEAVKPGGQSNFYILTVGEKKYAIKTHVADKLLKPSYTAIHQPYINEMLQTQAMAEDLKKELAELKVRMSTFLFASGQVSCTLYEEDDKNYISLNLSRLEEIKKVALEYVFMERYNENPLWDNVDIDLPVGVKLAIAGLRNFRTKSDGSLVWIDPFYYHRQEHVPAK